MTRRRTRPLTFALAGMALVVAGCGGGDATESDSTASGGDASISSDASAVLDVWIDATREPAVKAFQEANPDANINVTLIPADQPNYVSTKVQLANRAGSGWPDVAFLSDSGEIAQLQAEPFAWAAPLDDLVPADVREGFAASSIKNCNIAEATYCLQNDLAQTVLWYDKPLMDEFGYTVPTTWDEYAELGEQVAEEHPGYVIGSIEGRLGISVYYAASGCPFSTVTGPDTARINLDAVECTRVTDMLQPLLDNGAVSSKGIFDAEFVELGKTGKVLMLPSASWLGDFGFKPVYELPEGRLAAAEMPAWDGEESAWSGSIGGGVWAVSKHSKNQQGAADLISFVTTDATVQTESPTYPAFTSAAATWLEAKAVDDYYAEDPTPALKKQADLINPAFNYVRYNAAVSEGADSIVGPGLLEGTPLVDLLSEWEETLKTAAEDAGYTVED